MNRISALVASSVFALITLVACNASTTNASDVSSPGAAPRGKAVCTSLANWQSVGVGMDATQVQDRLGAPAKIITSATSTEYHYERCRGFLKIETAATETTPEKLVVINVEGVVLINAVRGVTAVTSPERIDATIRCEFDYYNHTEEEGFCRDSSNPY
ncbi:MAG: hypothetical protein Q7T48_16630 [Cellvibrio sp.]|uniref:hypothetical protein n=1 Tax=Cellvibrio sp. TaxID=1965322 RepID=UPI00271B9FF0|nr:hypothetical protein [Cellvibrio sp.]